MKKHILYSTLTVVLGAAPLANADESNFKVAIIKDAAGSKDIIKGNFNESLTKMTQTPATLIEKFEQAMGLCVANIKLSQLDAAEANCSSAIDAGLAMETSTASRNKLSALAYNNRAISRALSEDTLGALDDFTSAMLLNQSSLINNNLTHFKKQYVATLTVSTTDNTSYITH
ncbi:hypothetical protein LP316_05905 [Thalassotalea sp. LPB0316]|uniref:hypothetical protein n=1 Tax=Thalassotalea sp. LPB0316 TaxID=2769490 RepID=UPI0018661034|nr:hypothetical protein [Thalassotalea sp. LPB0316]QOL26829.1 hypothetical protein LP316_05905 [Thalassotalea sp. LPB0316]